MVRKKRAKWRLFSHSVDLLVSHYFWFMLIFLGLMRIIPIHYIMATYDHEYYTYCAENISVGLPMRDGSAFSDVNCPEVMAIHSAQVNPGSLLKPFIFWLFLLYGLVCIFLEYINPCFPEARHIAGIRRRNK